MKKFIYSLLIIGVFAFYTLIQSRSSSGTSLFSDDNARVVAPASLSITDPSTSQTTPTTTKPITTPPQTPTKAPVKVPTPPPVTTPKNKYKDGSFTGSVADAYYGNIQIKITISSGKITDVVFLQYPNDRSTSREINGQAMPYLKAEAIQAQSANVDIVSGATDSSQAFRISLASALAQAKN